MTYLKFNKEKLVNLEYSLEREMLLTNRAGGYVNTTIVGCNTRKYHGLLAVPVERFGGEKHILLSTLHESLLQHGKSFNLGINSYGEVYEPRGHKYIVDFEMDYASSVLYRVGGMQFQKTVMFMPESEEVLIRYTLLDAHSPTTLRIKPFLAFRNIHGLTRANTQACTRYREIAGGVAFRLYEGFPELHLQLNRKSEWVACPDWYHDIVYKEESRRGFADREDLFVPGYFEVPVRKGESIILSASTSEIRPRGLTARFEKELAEKDGARGSYEACLKLAARQFIIHQGGRTGVCAGYTWDYEDLRFSMIAAAGLTVYNDGDAAAFERIVDDAVKSRGEVFFGSSDQPDVPLWLFRALQQYIAWGADPGAVWKKYGAALARMLESYRSGVRNEITLHENGLLWSGRPGTALSWMNTYAGGAPVAERAGYQVEVNALWYNALRFASAMDRKYGAGKLEAEWGPVAGKIEDCFYRLFWVEQRRHLADYVGEEGQNIFTRPNQLMACAVEYSPIGDEVQMEVLRAIDRELLTARGIRTLSPKNPLYRGVYEGDQLSRDLAHYNGSNFPWLLGPYIESRLRLEGKSFVSRGRKLLAAFEEDMNVHGVGSVAEIYDGDPAHRPHGCISSSVSVAEIIRAKAMLDKISKKR